MNLSERFRTNYKNEIPIGEVRLYDLIDSNGAYIGKGVKLVRANGNLQEGDVFGEKEVNEIFKFFNGLLDGSEVVNTAVNASNSLDNFLLGLEDKPRAFNQWLGKDRRIKLTGNAIDGLRLLMLNSAGQTLGTILSSDSSGVGWVGRSGDATKLNGQKASYYATQFAMNHFQKYAQIAHNPSWRVSPSEGFKMISFSTITYPNGTPDFPVLELTGNGYPRTLEAGIYEVWVDRIQTSAPVSLVINKMSINTVMDVCVSGHAIIKMSKSQYFDITLATNTANVSITYANVSIRRVA